MKKLYFSLCLTTAAVMPWVAACGGDVDPVGPDPNDPNPAVVEITSILGVLGYQFTAKGQTAQLTAVAKNLAGTVVATAFTWSTSSPGTVGVDANGVVTANTMMAAASTITATASNGVSGDYTVSVDVLCHEDVRGPPDPGRNCWGP